MWKGKHSRRPLARFRGRAVGGQMLYAISPGTAPRLSGDKQTKHPPGRARHPHDGFRLRGQITGTHCHLVGNGRQEMVAPPRTPERVFSELTPLSAPEMKDSPSKRTGRVSGANPESRILAHGHSGDFLSENPRDRASRHTVSQGDIPTRRRQTFVCRRTPMTRNCLGFGLGLDMSHSCLCFLLQCFWFCQPAT